jgi:hypothetical protein
MVQDRSQYLISPEDRQPYFLDRVVLAMKAGTDWRFLDPANEYAKDGQLHWSNEGNWALVLDDKAPALQAVPVSAEGQSLRTRTAALNLSEDGTLAGDVVVTYTVSRPASAASSTTTKHLRTVRRPSSTVWSNACRAPPCRRWPSTTSTTRTSPTWSAIRGRARAGGAGAPLIRHPAPSW